MKQSASTRSENRNLILVILIIFLVAPIASAKTADQAFFTTNARALESQATVQEPKQTDVRELKPGAPIERELASGATHSYSVMLIPGQYLKVVIEQKGIDVVVRLFGPDGQKITEVDSPNGTQGPEPVSMIAEAAGAYRLEVKSLEEKAPAGRYEIKLEELRESTTKDRDRIAAERALAEAEQFRGQGTAESLRKAIDKYQQALPLWHTVGDRQKEASTLNLIGQIYWQFGESQKALEYHSQAVSLTRAAGDRKEEAQSLYYIGVVYWQLGDSRKALEYYNQALPLSRTVGYRQLEANTLTAIGLAYNDLGQLREALDYYSQSLVLLRALRDPTGEATTLNNIGLTYHALGELQKALEYSNQALLLRRVTGNRRDEAITLNNIGGIYNDLGEHQKALEYYNQALPLRRVTGDRSGESNTLHNIGSAYESLGESQKALEYFNQTLSLLRALGDRRGEAFTLQNIGIGYRSLGEPQKALDFLNQALLLRRAVGDRRGESVTLSRIGTTYSSLGKPEEALPYLEQALSLQRLVGARSDEAETLQNIARAERDRGRLDVARSQIETALTIVESTRSKFVGQQLRTLFSASTQEYYELYISLLMRMHQEQPSAGYDVTAFGASERARARSLLDILTESRADIRRGVDPVLLERERSLQHQLNARSEGLTRLLSGKHTEEQETVARKEVETLLADYQDVEAEIRTKSPRYAALTQPQPLSLKEIQRVLDKDTLLLEYSLGGERSYLWAVTPTSIKSFELSKRAEIETAAQQFHKLVTGNENREIEAQTEAAAALSHLLLAPVADELGQKRLVIVSDGALQYVPFAALPIPVVKGKFPAVTSRSRTNKQPATHKYQPLIVLHDVVQLPSASVLAVLRQQTAGRTPAAKMVAVLADPVFQSVDPRVKRDKTSTGESRGVAAARSDEPYLDSDVKRSAWESGLQDLQRLPFSRREAEAIAALTPVGQSLKALDFDASHATVTSDKIAQYRIIHFATHGLLNSVHPELSGIVLSLVDEAGQPQDGFLRLHEIYNLNLPAELVVLSGCQTALGKQVKGEGLIGLTRGFMYAGATRLVVSLWEINDEATAELMKRFYEGMLMKGMRPAAALRTAQLAMWKSKWWNAPYYWAGFVMQGEWR